VAARSTHWEEHHAATQFPRKAQVRAIPAFPLVNQPTQTKSQHGVCQNFSGLENNPNKQS
jgi:hypothetical protein